MAAPGTSPAPAHHPYKITSQEKTQTFTPDGRFVLVWRVGYESLTSHTHSFVEIPDSEYTPQRVDQIIQQELDAIEGTHQLGEQPHPENLANE